MMDIIETVNTSITTVSQGVRWFSVLEMTDFNHTVVHVFFCEVEVVNTVQQTRGYTYGSYQHGGT